ncbi:MAG: DNA primase [Acutalibacteraceae bacterium]|nr:DNA primase [Clostridia bacterium]MBQ2000268.1 DNA primase [Clostridia bacterium]MBQ2318734.1 DNA primase [Clostridia bacterium]MBQ2420139.1 DNA primase [Clostridia bacterium]MEE1127528.1 DNA primase [Acutalibacteraceae bacterium]
MRIPDEFIEELRQRNDIESVVSSYVTLKRRGSTSVGLCPFHSEKSPSFTVYPSSNSYYCFGCGAGGDPITFIRGIENLDYIEAVRFLADRCGMRMPESGYDDTMQKLRVKIYEINRAAARFFHEQLKTPEGKVGLDYFKERELSAKTIKHFGLGYAPESWDALYKHLRGLGFTDDLIFQADLISKRKSGNGYYDRFRGRAMYPIIDLRGNVIAFGGRRINNEDKSVAKYINSSDTPVYKKSTVLYALNYAKNSKHKGIILAEGYMDVIALHQAGFDNAVAACGTAFTQEQARLLSRYTDEIIVTLDADEAGQKATNRTIEILKSTGMNIRVLRVDGAKDPDEFIKKFGAGRFQALLDGANNDIEYKISAAKAKFDITTDDGKLSALKQISQVLSQTDDPIARDLYTGRVADEFGVSKDVLIRQINVMFKSRLNNERKQHINKEISRPVSTDRVNPEKRFNTRAAMAEETILALLFSDPSLYEYVFSLIKADDFVTTFNGRVYKYLCDLLENGKTPDISYFSSEFTPDEMGKIVGIFNKRLSLDTNKQQVDDCVKVILGEQDIKKAADSASESDWAASIKRITDKKRGSK